MATAACPPEEFICSVCLEILRNPATLPCGHTYCLPCIQKHWDQGAFKGLYSCPQCRQAFTPRPSLSRSTVLVEAMEKLRVRDDRPSSPVYLSMLPTPPVPAQPSLEGAGGAPVQGGLYPPLPASSPRLCPQHQQPLELYCCDDKECVCDECSLLGHKGHRVVLPEEERTERRQKLVQMQAEIQWYIQERAGDIQKGLPHAAQPHKELQKESKELFAELVKSVELTGSQVEELLQAHEASSCSRAEELIQKEIAQLRRRDDELRRIACLQDPIAFLNDYLTMDAPVQVGSRDGGTSHHESVAAGVRAVLGALSEGLQDLSKASLASLFTTVNDAHLAPMANGEVSGAEAPVRSSDPPAQSTANAVTPHHAVTTNRPSTINCLPYAVSAVTPSHPVTTNHPSTVNRLPNPANELKPSRLAHPEPKTRDEMLKFRFEPTLDHNTAHRHILLSDGDRKATLRAENQKYPDHPDRFLYWRQILCLEPLAGSPYYWEVDWTGQKVTIAVTYRGLGRTAADGSSRLGHNEHSWSLYWSGTAFSLWHAGKETPLASPKARKIGIYLDQQAGVLAFHRVSHGQAQLIHSLQADFSGPLFPGFRFWSGVGSTVTLCRLD